MTAADPRVAVLLPCHDEAEHLPAVLDVLLAELPAAASWQLIAVDDSSRDGTADLLDAAAAQLAGMRVIHGRYGSPGRARSVAASTVTVLGHHPLPDWLLTLDCDVEVPPGFVAGWADAIGRADGDASIGALNGGEEQGHLFDGLPNARAASASFGVAAGIGEARVGITNLNGVNHAIRTSAYLSAGPYVQPTVPGPAGDTNLAGSDWDLGVRTRLAGYRIEESAVTVRDRGRRLYADLFAYLSGTAYEGGFARVHATAAPVDIDADLVPGLADAATDRALFHFFFKMLLADPRLVHGDAAGDLGLDVATVAAMREWIERWPSPSFLESRNGFVYGRLPRFATEFTAAVREQFGLVGQPSGR